MDALLDGWMDGWMDEQTETDQISKHRSGKASSWTYTDVDGFYTAYTRRI
jgi:hypothetical protein